LVDGVAQVTDVAQITELLKFGRSWFQGWSR